MNIIQDLRFPLPNIQVAVTQLWRPHFPETLQLIATLTTVANVQL